MWQVGIHNARRNLSRLVEQAAKGEPFVITQSGKPLVTVSAYTLLQTRPTPWLSQGQNDSAGRFRFHGQERATGSI